MKFSRKFKAKHDKRSALNLYGEIEGDTVSFRIYNCVEKENMEITIQGWGQLHWLRDQLTELLEKEKKSDEKVD